MGGDLLFRHRYQGSSFTELLKVDYPQLDFDWSALAGLPREPVPHGTTVLAVRYRDGVLVAGVAHHPIQEVAAALPLAFDTPLGRVEVDLEALGALDALVPFELFNTPLAFREEHSVEFPVVFLKGVWPEASFKILPLIVSGSEEASALEELARALEVLAKDYPFLPVASVDLSHVGARFGHGPLTRALATRAQSMDRRYLELVAGGEFDRAFLDVTLPKNPTGIDAYATVHALKAVLRGTGEVVAYRFSAEVETLSAVGAGAVLYR